MSVQELYTDYETVQCQVAYQWLPGGLGRVLEIGCSSGYFTRRLKDKAQDVYGFDVNEEHIDIARKNFPDIHFTAIDANSTLPYEDGYFDAIVMLEVYEHVANQPEFMKEVGRILKSGGKLILSTPNKGLFSFLDAFNLKLFFLRKTPALSRFVSRHLQRHHNTQYTENLTWHPHYSLKEMKGALSRQFEITKVHRGGLLLFPLFAIFRSVLIRTFPNKGLFKFFVGLMNADGRISYGPAAYNLHIMAEKQ